MCKLRIVVRENLFHQSAPHPHNQRKAHVCAPLTCRIFFIVASSIPSPSSISPALFPNLSVSSFSIRALSLTTVIRAHSSSCRPPTTGSNVSLSSFASLAFNSSSPASRAYPLFRRTCTLVARARHRRESATCRLLASSVRTVNFKSCSSILLAKLASISLTRSYSAFTAASCILILPASPISPNPRASTGMHPSAGLALRASSHLCGSSPSGTPK